jgi:hypothetical protein
MDGLSQQVNNFHDIAPNPGDNHFEEFHDFNGHFNNSTVENQSDQSVEEVGRDSPPKAWGAARGRYRSGDILLDGSFVCHDSKSLSVSYLTQMFRFTINNPRMRRLTRADRLRVSFNSRQSRAVFILPFSRA